MRKLTRRQEQVLEFVRSRQQNGQATPSLREIAAHFGFQSMNAAVTHVRALRQKGLLRSEPRRARSLQVVSPLQDLRKPIVDVPVFGAIPAGFAEDRRQEVKGCISVDAGTLGIRPNGRTFALIVRGESMVGKNIVDGDYVILERDRTPRSGDVVAALIDHESTLKTFVLVDGNPVLRAENPRYPELIPAQELVVQGVMIALVRRRP